LDIDSGRSNQKYRTRRALLAAARKLMKRKAVVTVAATADAAMISKATAYRYFATAEALMREALLDGDWSTPEEVVGEATDVVERVRRVHRYLFSFTRKNESAHRLFLAKALEAWVAEGGKPKGQLRGARRLPMFEFALEPAREKLQPAAFSQLLNSLSAASGIESYIALKDVCGLDDAAADAISWSSVEAILLRALK
jgi:AcrR family transcriptional regulator